MVTTSRRPASRRRAAAAADAVERGERPLGVGRHVVGVEPQVEQRPVRGRPGAAGPAAAAPTGRAAAAGRWWPGRTGRSGGRSTRRSGCRAGSDRRAGQGPHLVDRRQGAAPPARPPANAGGRPPAAVAAEAVLGQAVDLADGVAWVDEGPQLDDPGRPRHRPRGGQLRGEHPGRARRVVDDDVGERVAADLLGRRAGERWRRRCRGPYQYGRGLDVGARVDVEPVAVEPVVVRGRTRSGWGPAAVAAAGVEEQVPDDRPRGGGSRGGRTRSRMPSMTGRSASKSWRPAVPSRRWASPQASSVSIEMTNAPRSRARGGARRRRAAPGGRHDRPT